MLALPPLSLLFLTAFAVLMAGSACGGDSPSGTVIEMKAEQLRFVPDEIRIQRGDTVTLRLKNLDGTEHDLEIQGMRAEKMSGGGHGGHGSMMPGLVALHTARGETASVTFVAPSSGGTYDIWCTLPGHKDLGMVATLIVTD